MAPLIAIVGAESTGKTALALALAEALGGVAVPELLRAWCEREGRTPRLDEQAAIAAAQSDAIDQAARQATVVVCDTTALMTAVYSDYLFRDTSLYPAALAFHRRCAVTLLTALDLPWVADGLQRDGPHVQAPIDAAIRTALGEAEIGWQRVAGYGAARVQAALAGYRASSK